MTATDSSHLEPDTSHAPSLGHTAREHASTTVSNRLPPYGLSAGSAASPIVRKTSRTPAPQTPKTSRGPPGWPREHGWEGSAPDWPDISAGR